MIYYGDIVCLDQNLIKLSAMCAISQFLGVWHTRLREKKVKKQKKTKRSLITKRLMAAKKAVKTGSKLVKST